MTGVLNIILVTYIVCFLMVLMLCFFKPVNYKFSFYVLVLLFVVSMAILGYLLEPNKYLDVYRLYETIDSMRFSSQSFFSKILGLNTSYPMLISFNLICFFISLTDENAWLSAISVLLCFGSIFYVLISYLKENQYSSKYLLPSLLLIFMGMQIQYIFTGIRNSIAVSLAFLGLYLYHKYKSKVILTILFFASVTMHPVTLLLFLVMFICKSRHQIILRIVALFSSTIVFFISFLFRNIPYPFFNYLANRILFYSSNSYQFDRPEMIANFLVFIALAFSYRFLISNKQECETKLSKYYLNAYYLLGFTMLGFASYRDFNLRIGYMMGILGVPIYLYLFSRIKKNRYFFLINIGILLCFVKVYYDTFFVMLRMVF